jgi:hypothetical protein
MSTAQTQECSTTCLPRVAAMNSLGNQRVPCICLMLAVATLLAYCGVVSCSFLLFDDPYYVTLNPYVTAGLSLESVKWAFTALNANTSYWHPLTWLSHMLDYQVFGASSCGHHFTSLIIHVINTLLLFLFLQNTTTRVWTGAFVAGLFALHPLHVESVAWVSERKDVVSTMFWLLALTAYVRYVSQPTLFHYLLTIFMFILSLMSKPMTVTLPFVLFLLDYWPLQRFSGTSGNGRKSTGAPYGSTIRGLVLEKIPFIALSVAITCVTIIAQKDAGAIKTVGDFPIHARAANALISYVAYMYKMLLPLHLACFYPHPGSSVSLAKATAAGIVLIGLTFLLLRMSRRRPYGAVGWLWFLGTLLPVIGLIQVGIQGMADRYTYVPLIGLFLAVSWTATDLIGPNLLGKRVLGTLAVLILCVLAISTARQVSYWRNNTALLGHALRVTKDNFLALGGLGSMLLVGGDYAAADKLFSQSLAARPDYQYSLGLLGESQLQQGKLEKAVEQFQKLLSINAKNSTAHRKLAVIYRQQKRPSLALDHLTEVIATEPFSPDVLAEMVSLFLDNRCAVFENLRRTIDILEQSCLQQEQRNPYVLDALAASYYVAGRIPEAISTSAEALNVAIAAKRKRLATTIEDHKRIYLGYPEQSPSTSRTP